MLLKGLNHAAIIIFFAVRPFAYFVNLMLDCVSNQPYIVVLFIYYEFKCMEIESNLRSFERSELERKCTFYRNAIQFSD